MRHANPFTQSSSDSPRGRMADTSSPDVGAAACTGWTSVKIITMS